MAPKDSSFNDHNKNIEICDKRYVTWAWLAGILLSGGLAFSFVLGTTLAEQNSKITTTTNTIRTVEEDVVQLKLKQEKIDQQYNTIDKKLDRLIERR